jgi:hypothetical protein
VVIWTVNRITLYAICSAVSKHGSLMGIFEHNSTGPVTQKSCDLWCTILCTLWRYYKWFQINWYVNS